MAVPLTDRLFVSRYLVKCPKCGGSMKIKAFIVDPEQVIRLCKNLGLQDWRAPPKPALSLPNGMGKDRKFQVPD